MVATKAALFEVLSTESRLAQTRRELATRACVVLQQLARTVEARREAVAHVHDAAAAERALATFRQRIDTVRERFDEVTRRLAQTTRASLEAREEVQNTLADAISLLAEQELARDELEDVARHWRTRRNGGWGTMHDVESRVANRIFPRVQSELDRSRRIFEAFVADFGQYAAVLKSDARAAVGELRLSVDLDVGVIVEEFLIDARQGFETAIEDENRLILALLDGFVTDEVDDRILAARHAVAGILGKGTTVGQSQQVRAFYANVRAILREAVRAHLAARFAAWTKALARRAEDLGPHSAARLEAELARVAVDIRTAAETAAAEDRQRFETMATDLIHVVMPTTTAMEELLGAGTVARSIHAPANPAGDTATDLVKADGSAKSEQPREDDVVGRFVDDATELLCRHRLLDGVKGWGFDRILAGVPAGATQVWVIDPYLLKKWQRRNLEEFLLAVARRVRPKRIDVITGFEPDGGRGELEALIAEIDRSAFEDLGTTVRLERRVGLHDRSVVMDNGTVIKLGRGLDIFKPAAGFAARDPSLRAVRGCEIDIFGNPATASSVAA